MLSCKICINDLYFFAQTDHWATRCRAMARKIVGYIFFSISITNRYCCIESGVTMYRILPKTNWITYVLFNHRISVLWIYCGLGFHSIPYLYSPFVLIKHFFSCNILSLLSITMHTNNNDMHNSDERRTMMINVINIILADCGFTKFWIYISALNDRAWKKLSAFCQQNVVAMTP